MADEVQQSSFVSRAGSAFSPAGLLAEKLPGFRPRDSQREFAEAVARTIESSGTLIAEAGTGTGKTFAYLVPALQAGIRVLISTAGKPLQDQLYTKDLPLILQALGIHANTVLLKGRANYICRKRLNEVDWLPSREDVGYLRDIQMFAARSETGDRAELKRIPENASIWPYVTSSRENCTGSKCPFYEECFLTQARRRAKDADILVVNHHLLLGALAAAGDGTEELLPAVPLTVIDEAHQIPAIATDFFGDIFSTVSVSDFSRDVLVIGKSKAPDGAKWDDLTHRIDTAVKELRLAAVTSLELGENDRRKISNREEISPLAGVFSQLDAELYALGQALAVNAERDPDIELLMRRCEEFLEQIGNWEKFAEDGADEEEENSAPHVRWIQAGKNGVRFCDTPLSFAGQFRQLRDTRGGSWVLTSATLSVAGKFDHFLSETGLDATETHSWPSPFDFFSQAALYVPPGMPDPNSGSFSEAVAEKAWPFIRKACGRTFVLCTSLRAVETIADRLESLSASEGVPLQILRQGSGTRKGLLERFRSEPDTVLVGSMSFWEGIDIRGDDLSVVVIDRIPFSPPDDPVMSARCEWVQRQGGHPFFSIQIPEAVTLLRQGVGRLIRSESDRGVLVFCDPRLISKWGVYGKTIVSSLPDFCRTQKLERALAYLNLKDR